MTIRAALTGVGALTGEWGRKGKQREGMGKGESRREFEKLLRQVEKRKKEGEEKADGAGRHAS